MRVDSLLLFALALGAGSLAAVAPVSTGLSFAMVLLLAFGRVRPVLMLSCGLAFAIGMVSARASLAAWQGAWLRARTELPEPLRCAGVAEVRSSPARLGGGMSFLAELRDVDCEGRVLSPLSVRLHGGPLDLRRGDRLELVTQLSPVQLFRNRELPDPSPGSARRGASASGMILGAERIERRVSLASLSDAARNHARAAIDRSFVPAAAPLARALVLGESDLDPEDDRAFRASGLSHLLAVSGTHLVFAVGALVSALGALFTRIESLAARVDSARIAAALGAPIALAYADFAGGSGSAWRAAWMLAAAYGVRAVGRHPRVERTLGVSLVVGACADPLLAFDVSFLLSAGATVGLVVFGQPLSRLTDRVRLRPLRFLLGSTATTVSAMLPCAPLLALLAPEQTLAGVLANTLAAPIGEAVALPLCLLHPVVAGVPGLDQGIALVGSGALLWVRGVAHVGASMRFLAFPIPAPSEWHYAVLAVAVLGAWLRPPRVAWALAGAALLGAVELAAHRAGHPRGELRVTVLDIGQGDAILVDLPDGSLMLIDAGGSVGGPIDPGARVVAPVLRARRRSRVDVVVLSHPHPDHFGGLEAALARVEVGEFWDSGQGRAEGAGPVYRALFAKLRAPVLGPRELCPEPRRFGGAEVELLAPCPDFVPGRDANDNSLVLALRFGSRRALLLGDAEQEEEHELVERYGDRLAADFLKVGHHGSRTSSSPALLAAVRPTHAAISCGVRNRFGHPHPETLAALRARGIHTLRTDRQGAVSWLTDGAELFVDASVRAD